MRIQGTEVTRRNVEIEVDVNSVCERLCMMVLANHGIKHSGVFLDKQGRMVYEEEQHTSHTYFTTEVLIAKPTEKQIQAMNLVVAFQAAVRDCPK